MMFEPLGDSAVVVTLSEALTDTVLQEVQDLAAALRRTPIPGILDVVPAYTTVTVVYDPVRFSVGGARPYPTVCQFITWSATKAKVGTAAPFPKQAKSLEIPVCYGGDLGPDLEKIAARAGLSKEAVIAAHAGATYTVQAIGFSPGFPYLTGLPPALATPRLEKPRVKVPAGSVAIGGTQAGVYPMESPGGWNLIGRTPLSLFVFDREQPALLSTGDQVRFVAIGREAFDTWK